MKTTNLQYQLGLMHLVHLLVSVDGTIDDREREAIRSIKREEEIPDNLFNEFEHSIVDQPEADIYYRGIDLLNRCTEEEKLCAFVHLYRLAEADASIHIKEVRLLLYGIKVAHIEFDDVVLSARLTQARRQVA